MSPEVFLKPLKKNLGWIRMKKFFFSFMFLFLLTTGVHAKETITIYTAVEVERLPKYQKIIQKALPDCEINWIRESTGVITARLLAEAKAPQADLVFGVGASSLLLLHERGLLTPYAPKNLDKLSPVMYDASTPPIWVGLFAWGSAFSVNTIELKKRNLAMPSTWQDLIKPEYKDLIAMPAPASSGTGYTNLTTWIQLFGEEKGWEYAEKLMKNTKFLVHSGSAPATMAAQGEAVIGLTLSAYAQDMSKKVKHLQAVIPSDGVVLEVESAAIVKNSPNEETAKKIMDLLTSDEIVALANEFSGSILRTDFIIKNADKSSERIAWAAKNREQLLEEWKKRFAK